MRTKAAVLFICLNLFSQTPRTDLTKEEKLEVLDWNKRQKDALDTVQAAYAKAQGIENDWKAYLKKLQTAHEAGNCELQRSTVQWENCKSPVEKKKQ